MPPWGAKECRLDNNPFVMAVPGPDGGPTLQLDMAISQYAYGKLQVTRLAGKKLPFPGGFDKDGNLTDDPGAIEESMRILLFYIHFKPNWLQNQHEWSEFYNR